MSLLPRATPIPWLLALVLMPLAPAQPQEIPHTDFTLDNGLKVILLPDRRLPLVCVNLWYYVGSKDETRGRSGFAHLFEHLMFMGTKGVPYPEFDVRIETYGGSNNATTSEDRTNYYEMGPRALLETFLYLEADRMATLGASMTQEKLDTQRGVVRNERRQSYENRPYGKAQLELPQRLYPESHPYHHPVIGSHEDLEAATVKDVRDFFDNFYVPSNAALVVAGDFDAAEARRLVERHFGPLPARPAAPRVSEAPPVKLEGTKDLFLQDSVELPMIDFVWPSPAIFRDGDADLDVLASILGGGKSSRLYRSLVYEKELAQEVNVYQSSGYLGSELHVRVLAQPEASLAEIEAEVDRQVSTLLKEGPTERELQRAKNRIDTSFWLGMEGLLERADRLNLYQFHFGTADGLARDRARYDAVTRESVRLWGEKVLRLDARVHMRVTP